MSYASIRPYFRTGMNLLGFREHKDAFNIDNIPSTLLDKSYHIDTNNGTGGPLSAQSQEANGAVTIRVFRKGFKNPADMIDRFMTDLDNMLGELSDPLKRFKTVKNVMYTDYLIEPLSDSNDNSGILSVSFDAALLIAL